MSRHLKELWKVIVLWLIGGATYYFIEILWRGYSHQSMFILGGILFVILGGINEYIPWDMALWKQCVLGTVSILCCEFVAGLILNVWLGLGIWDYSNMKYNIMGQVCPQFAFAWCGLSLVGIILDDYIRYWFWNEEKPHYKLF